MRAFFSSPVAVGGVRSRLDGHTPCLKIIEDHFAEAELPAKVADGGATLGFPDSLDHLLFGAS